MLPGKVSQRIVGDRLVWIERMLAEIRALPLESQETFFSDSRNIWAAESCLRRALEALFDLGRHLLAKGLGAGVTEYKEIATTLRDRGILPEREADLMRKMAGYRNRLVHFYRAIREDEVYEICTRYLGEVAEVADALRAWLKAHPERIEGSL